MNAFNNAKPKKPIYKRVWFWIIVGYVSLIFILGGINRQIQKNSTKANAEYTEPLLSEDEYKKSCKTIDYKALLRNPERHKGEKIKFTGKVYKVLEFDSETEGEVIYNMRIRVTKDEYGFWDDTVCATIDLSEKVDKFLEDDIVTIWGECDGEYVDKGILDTYSYPVIKIEYYTIK